MIGCIYKITERETGFIYIGQSKDKRNLKRRWKVHESRWPGCYKEIIITAPHQDLDELEILMIATFDSHRNGLNRTIGGSGIKTRFPHNETRQKQSKAKKGKTSPNKGKSPSEETRQKQSEVMSGRSKPKSQCPYCNILCAANTMSRWHGDKCKNKKENL